MKPVVSWIIRGSLQQHRKAGVMELVDVPDSKSGAREGVGVRFPPPAPTNERQDLFPAFFLYRLIFWDLTQ